FVTWTAANNALTIVRSGGFDTHPAQSVSGFVVGQTYKATFDVSGAQAHAVFGGVSGNFSAGTGNSITWTANAVKPQLEFWPVNDPSTAIISNVQIRQVPN